MWGYMLAPLAAGALAGLVAKSHMKQVRQILGGEANGAKVES